MPRTYRHIFWIYVLVSLASLCVFAPSISAQEILIGDATDSTIKEFSISPTNQVTYMGIFAQGGGLSIPYGMAYGPDGNLYVANEGNSTILEYNGKTGAFLGTFATQGEGGLYYPNDIAFGPDGNLYVTSYSGGSVLKFTLAANSNPGTFTSGTADGVFASAPVSNGIGLQGATGLAFQQVGDQTTLFVNSSQNGQVFQFNATTGAQIGTGPYINDPSHIGGPAGLTFGLNGNLFETSFLSTTSNTKEQIAQYNTSISPTSATFTSLFTNSSNLNGPADILLASADGVHYYFYVTNYNTGTVYRFNATSGLGSSTPIISTATLGVGASAMQPLYMVLVQNSTTSTSSSQLISGGQVPSVVPEPSSLALLAIGGAGIALISRRRRCGVT